MLVQPGDPKGPVSHRPLNEIFADNTSRRAATVVCFDQRGSTHAKITKSESDWVAQTIKVYDTILTRARKYCPDVASSFTGDGMMLFYDGDDYATVAVQTAIEVQEELARLNRPANNALVGVIDVKVSVGIASGDPWWFETAPGHPNVIGTCADIAARLCNAATPQAILIDEETASVMNPKKIVSKHGEAEGRTPQQYVGDKQHLALKGIPDPVGYFEVLWEQQRFGVRSEMATPPSDQEKHTVDSPPVLKASLHAVGTRAPEKATGKIKCFSAEKGFGFITTSTGEDLYLSPSLLVYPEEAKELRVGDMVVFTIVEPAVEGRNRRAAAVLVVGEEAEATLVAVPNEQRRHGWLKIEDQRHNYWLLYASAPDLPDGVRRGDNVVFTLEVGPAGAKAVGLALAEDEESA
jgi:class 3 adenylate cyclase/cold shock CspA family protein